MGNPPDASRRRCSGAEAPREHARGAGRDGPGLACLQGSFIFTFTSSFLLPALSGLVFWFRRVFRVCLPQPPARRGKYPPPRQPAKGWTTGRFWATWRFSSFDPGYRTSPHTIRYSRLTDDITISSARKILPGIKTTLVAAIYAMLYRSEYRPNRKKHFLFTRKNSMRVNNLVVNVRAGLPREERRIIRTEVHRFIQEISRGRTPIDSAHSLGRLGKLARFHLVKAQVLRKRLASADRNWHN